MTSLPLRTLVLWIPDWPIVALAASGAVSAQAQAAAVAVVRDGHIVACSAAARREGVRRGQRRRDAQSRCPSLLLVPADLGRDVRGFEPVLGRVEQLAPGTHPIRPGLLALRARGPARYYGGEEAAARVLRDGVAELGHTDVRAGVGDGPFTAEHAARRSPPGGILVVPRGESADFLAPQPVATLDEPELTALLTRLGVRTLGEFAALDADRVRARFGTQGERCHSLAAGRDHSAVHPRVPPPELTRETVFEPALELAEQVAFGVRRTCEHLIEVLGETGLVCTALRVEITDEDGRCSDRLWRHPTFFTASEAVDRVRWQLEALAGAATADRAPSAVAKVRLIPELVDDSRHHAPSLFGQGPGERVHHALSRVQSMLGHRGVLTGAVGAGRSPAERQILVAWGDLAPEEARRRDQPWPGSLPAPHPSIVYPSPRSIHLVDAAGDPVLVDERGELPTPPAWVQIEGRSRQIVSWAGPWPLHERPWDPARKRDLHRFQLVDATQTAWLVIYEGGTWHAEGRYD